MSSINLILSFIFSLKPSRGRSNGGRKSVYRDLPWFLTEIYLHIIRHNFNCRYVHSNFRLNQSHTACIWPKLSDNSSPTEDFLRLRLIKVKILLEKAEIIISKSSLYKYLFLNVKMNQKDFIKIQGRRLITNFSGRWASKTNYIASCWLFSS